MARWGVFAACLYEAVALASRRCPTFSAMAAKRKWLAPAILIALAIHLYRHPPAEPAGEPVRAHP